jgi:phenylalanyl-tRNA synthetase alpha chain
MTQNDIEKVKEQAASFAISNETELEAFRMKFLAKNGILPAFFEAFKGIDAQERKVIGKPLNELKKYLETKLKDYSEIIDLSAYSQEKVDLSLPSIPNKTGNLHPLTLTRFRIIEVFERLGFSVEDGPEIEDDWHNFSALNFPDNHPAREMQDTFFIEKNPDILLRTHTSNVQIRLMEKQRPPIRAIMPGRVYRNEAISARAHCFFHQVEGLYVNKNVSFADLKQTLYHFAMELYGKDIKIRYRPSFFPFTEPSAEIDISCLICKGKGCNICKYTGWVEIAGSGMVHPNVLKNCNIDPEEYTGFAFGMGVERVAQLLFNVNDLRLYSENDVRFLKQFKTYI